MSAEPQSLRQILWLPDECLRFRIVWRICWRPKVCRDRQCPTTPTSSSSTPATSAKRRPKRSIPSLVACGLKEAAARSGRRVTIAVAGCVAQAEGEEIIRRAPAVDLVVGPQIYHRLPDLLARAEK